MTHPNRATPEARATRAAVVLLLVLAAALIAIVTGGGWAKLHGMQVVAVLYALAYVVLAGYVARWRRGALPLAAGLAVLFAVVAAVAAPAWFARAKDGLAEPALDPITLGILTAALVPVQLALAAFAMRGFGQRWNEEGEAPQARSDGRTGDVRPGSLAG